MADYVRATKVRFGVPHMSDRAFGERLGGYATSTISEAKRGRASDHLAVAIAEALGVDPGEVLLVARAERERDATIRGHLLAYAKKVIASVPKRGAAVIAALAL